MSDLTLFKSAVIVASIMSIAMIIGASGLHNGNGGDELLQSFIEQVKDRYSDISPFQMATEIFVNNIIVGIILFLGGVTLAFVTCAVVFVNGWMIGAFYNISYGQVSLREFLVAVVPHGVFELPAFVISGALGLMLAGGIWQEMKGGADAADYAVLLGRKFVLVVLPLLLIAAIVEAFITPQILNVMI